MGIFDRLKNSLAGDSPAAARGMGMGKASLEVLQQFDQDNPFDRSRSEEGGVFGGNIIGRKFRAIDPSKVKNRLHSGKTEEKSPTAVLERRIKEKLYERFVEMKELPADFTEEQERAFYSKQIDEVIVQILSAANTKLPDSLLKGLKEDILNGITGFGPIQKLLAQADVSEVMVNGPDNVYVEKRGKVTKTKVKFHDPGQLYQVIEKICIPIGRRCDEFSPYTDARLPDGSRVNIIIPPLSLIGPAITIRKFSKTPLQMSDLVGKGTATQGMADFIKCCVDGKMNIIVSGGTGSGKTTTLNAVSAFLPATERIVTIEDSAELQLLQPHVVSLETRQANVEGKGSVSIRDLFRNALRMIPKRVVVGECRGGESLDMIHGMSSGNAGSLTTAHANTPKDLFARIETMIMMAGMGLSSRMIRELIASAVNIVLQQERMPDGTRRITHVAEVTGIVDGEVQSEDVFRFIQTGVDDDGKVLGAFKCTGYIPKCMDNFFEDEIGMPEDIFEGVASVSQLRRDWRKRKIDDAKKEERRVRSQIALQMAMEESPQEEGSTLNAEPKTEDQGPTGKFTWRDASPASDTARGSTGHGGRSTAQGGGGSFGRSQLNQTTRNAVGALSTQDPDRNSSLVVGKARKAINVLTDRLAEAADQLAEYKTPGATADNASVTLDRQFKRRVLGRLPALLAWEWGDRPFANREEEATVVMGLAQKILNEVVAETRWFMPPRQRDRVLRDCLADVVGLGPIQKFIDDPFVTEIMVNGPRKIFVEMKGKLTRVPDEFEDDGHVMHILQKILSPLSRRCDETSPMVDARTQQGFRVNAIISPLSIIGPCITIRKFADKPFTMDKLVEFGALSREAADFLHGCVMLKLNIFVSGGTGSGKTTTLNAISGYIPECRIVTIEDAAELRLQQAHVVSLETRPANAEGRGSVTIRELVRNSLHMRPDRIIVGECRGGEALDMISSMCTGNKGSLSTGHANTPKDLLRRLETMIMMSGVELPMRAIRDQIAAAVDLIIQQDRLSDGSRKITHISEVLADEDEGVKIQDIFRFHQKGVDERTGKVIGQLDFTGIVPTFLVRFLDEGVSLPEGVFGPGVDVKGLVTELDQRRREVENEAITHNLRKTHTYEEAVLLDPEFFEQSENPLMMLDDTKTQREYEDPIHRKNDRAAMAGKNFEWRTWLETNFPTKKEDNKKRIDAEEKNKLVIADILAKQDHSDVLIGQDAMSFADDEEERTFLHQHLRTRMNEVMEAKHLFLKQATQDEIASELADDFLRLGPIQKLMDDDSISEIMVNAPDRVFVEKRGKLSRVDVSFRDDDHILRILNRILAPIGRRCDVNSPLVDARTKQGYRLNAVIPPVSPAPVMTIRKFAKRAFQMADLMKLEAISPVAADFLAAAVQIKLNIVVSGGTGSGKTTMLNALSAYIPNDERILTIEDTAELQMQQMHVVSLETRQANQEGKGAIPIRDLVRNSLRMRPDRIVVGECRGGEALDMLQAMNTGHGGALTTAHASSPKDMMARLETMALMAEATLPARAIREQIASAIDMVIQISRFRDGTRKVTHISEVRSLHEDTIELVDIFTYQKSGVDSQGRVKGRFGATGNLPSFLLKFQYEGITLPEDVFGPGTSITKIYERLERESKARDSREQNRERLRNRWGGSLEGLGADEEKGPLIGVEEEDAALPVIA